MNPPRKQAPTLYSRISSQRHMMTCHTLYLGDSDWIHINWHSESSRTINATRDPHRPDRGVHTVSNQFSLEAPGEGCFHGIGLGKRVPDSACVRRSGGASWRSSCSCRNAQRASRGGRVEGRTKDDECTWRTYRQVTLGTRRLHAMLTL